MPRYVILEHDHPELHWDLMLEAGETLQTWRLAQPLAALPCVMDAIALGDHRRVYLDYEGPVSGNRGTVKRWDAGTFTELADSTPEARQLVFAGARFRGRVRLTHIGETRWRFDGF